MGCRRGHLCSSLSQYTLGQQYKELALTGIGAPVEYSPCISHEGAQLAVEPDHVHALLRLSCQLRQHLLLAPVQHQQSAAKCAC